VMASPDIIGRVLPVTIESLERYSLLGELTPSVRAQPAQHLSSHITNPSHMITGA